ncbi:MAG: GTP cyclohydrolase II RibA [Rhodospirillaceae bacterium]|nr:GTP cyclohydrolase II RibA [Rhodospirillaceae bacterium]
MLRAKGDGLIVAAAEMLGGSRLAALHAEGSGAAGLVLPAPRLAHLDLASDTPAHMSLAGLSGAEIDSLLIDVKPVLPKIEQRPARPLEATALELVKRAYLLPAAMVQPSTSEDHLDLAHVDAAAVEHFHDDAARDLAIAARTHIPLADVEDAEIVVFHGGDGLHDQVAIVVGQPDPTRPVLTRLHSACLTGDLLGSLKCDCGEQLRLAVREIAATGGGVLLYLDQEGRGIGLANKIRAYGLQEQGHDTLDADAILGYGPDERRYGVASAMLKLLGYRDIVLLTNNPGKISALADYGIHVLGHRRLMGSVNPHNEVYLTTKAQRAGHLLGKLGLRVAGE